MSPLRRRVLAAQALSRGLTDPLRADAMLAAVAGHLTRDDTLTVGKAVRLAGQFRRSRPGALVGLTIPTVPRRAGAGSCSAPASPASGAPVALRQGCPTRTSGRAGRLSGSAPAAPWGRRPAGSGLERPAGRGGWPRGATGRPGR